MANFACLACSHARQYVKSLAFDLKTGIDPTFSAMTVLGEVRSALQAGNGHGSDPEWTKSAIKTLEHRAFWVFSPEMFREWCGMIVDLITHRCIHTPVPEYQAVLIQNAPGVQAPVAAMEIQQPFVASTQAGPNVCYGNVNTVNQHHVVVPNAPVMQMAPLATDMQQPLAPVATAAPLTGPRLLKQQIEAVRTLPTAEREAIVAQAKQTYPTNVPAWAQDWKKDGTGSVPMTLGDYVDLCALKDGDHRIGARGNSEAWGSVAILFSRDQWEAGRELFRRRHQQNKHQVAKRQAVKMAKLAAQAAAAPVPARASAPAPAPTPATPAPAAVTVTT